MFKGKAGSLKYLQDLGLNVPEWRSIKHEEIVSWGNQEDWKELLHSFDPVKLERFLGSITVPLSVLAVFLDKGPYAVRSSASVEDSAENSFAGIFETKLFVKENLAKAIIEVWASLYSPSSLKYCKERSIPYEALAMDVIVQKMIFGEKSGVLFQADPIGQVTQQVIVAGWGLGQGIVDDVTDTDRLVVEGTEIVVSELSEKKTYLTYDESSNQLMERPVPGEKSLISVLNEKDLDKLLAASEKLATHNEHYLDLEFTFLGTKLYVLQARPITTIPRKSDLLVFDNSNIAENYPHQSTPLTFSALRRGYATNFKNLIAHLGFPEKERRALEKHLDQLVGYWGGQIYYNLNNWYSVYTLLPFGGERAISSFNDMVGIKTNSPVSSPKRSFPQNLRLLLIVLPKFADYYLRTHKHHQEYKRSFKKLHEEVKARSTNAKSALEIIALLQDYDTRYLEIIKIPLFNDFFSSILNHACRSLAKRTVGPEGERIYNDLLSHREDLESAKAIYSLIELSQSLANDSGLMDFMDLHKSDPQIMDLLKVRGQDYHQKLFAHFDRFGDRSQWEMKVEVPTARENPETTIKLILNYAMSGLSQEEQKRRERKKAQVAKTKLSRYTSKRPFQGPLFWSLFKKCTEALCFREDARFDRVRYKGLSRFLLLRLGEVLVRKGLLGVKEDLFYLTWDEVLSLQHDGFGRDYHKDLVALRKKHLKKLDGLSLPDRIVVNDITPVEKFGQVPTSRSVDQVFGIPCSGGTVEAECVVVHDLNMAPDLTGKILVAQRTDPAWGYFFVGVKGIIIEKGSMLSHAAIISRELGVPCIINVAGATKQLSTGTRLLMNGDTGEIILRTSGP